MENFENKKDSGNRLIVGFDKDGKIIDKNEFFSSHFPKITSKEIFDSSKLRVVDPSNSSKRFLKSQLTGEIISFVKVANSAYSFFVGYELDYGHIKTIVSEGKILGRKALDKKEANWDSKLYYTLVTDRNYNITSFSENVSKFLENPEILHKYLDEVLGDGVSRAIEYKREYLNIAGEMGLEMEDKMMTVSLLSCQYILINVYPFSSKALSRFDEIIRLHSEIEDLKEDLKQMQILIDFQKTLIKKLSIGQNNKNPKNSISESFNSKIKQIFDCEHGKNCYFIAVDTVESGTDKMQHRREVERLIARISSMLTIGNEKIYRMGMDSFGIILEYTEMDDTQSAIEKYKDFLSEELEGKSIKYKIINYEDRDKV